MPGEIPMSVRRLVAEIDTATINVSEFCVEHGISRWSFYDIRKRYEASGEAGLEYRSRAPKTVANKTGFEVEEQIIKLRKELSEEGLDAGAETIWTHLHDRLDPNVGVPSSSTIWRILKSRGFINDDPTKAPQKKYRSFQAERANEVWQIDGTTYELSTGKEVKIINVIDDGSRLNTASQAHRSESFTAVWQTVCAGGSTTGFPQRFLSDNGKANNKLEEPLATLGISMGHSRPYHPQTCGKVERFHQTQAKWLAARPPAATLTELQSLLDAFRHIYNHCRPHRAIGRKPPADRWAEMAKSGPAGQPLNLAARTTVTHSKVATTGGVASAGYIISIGSRYATQSATTIVTGTRAHVFIDAELIRALDIDPTKRVQPMYNRKGNPGKNPK